MSGFTDEAISAFTEVTAACGLRIGATSDDKFFPFVEWDGPVSSLIVRDNGRDGFLNVLIRRPLTPEERVSLLVCRDNGWLSVPLWAIVQAAGANGDDAAAGGDDRLAHLGRLAALAQRHAFQFLAGNWDGIEKAYEVVAVEAARPRPPRYLP